MTVSVMEALDLYENGGEEIIRAFTSVHQIGTVEEMMRREGSKWIAAHGPKELDHRRLVAATFALEAAGADLEKNWRESWSVIEWACSEIRKRPRSEVERLWLVASLGLLEGRHHRVDVEVHAGHLKSRYPDDPAVKLAAAWGEHLITRNSHAWQPYSQEELPFQSQLVRMYEKLGDTPELRGHALVNIGFLYMLAHRHGEARANLQRAAAPAHDADIRHVAHLLLGWIDLREKKQDEAIGNFQAALNISPHGRTAAAWLGFQLMLKGRLTEAEEAAQASLDPGRRPLDPWRLFGMGDYRRFPDLIKLIRKAIS